MTNEQIVMAEGLFQEAKKRGIAGTRESKDGSMIPTYRIRIYNIVDDENALYEFWQDAEMTHYERIRE